MEGLAVPNNIQVNDIREWIRGRLADLLGVDVSIVRVDEAMTRYGLNSQRATQLVADLGQWLNRTISPVLIWEYPTVELLSAHLAAEQTGARARPSRESQSTSTDEPIAVVGIACRFPGGLDRDEFWQSICSGQHIVEEIDDSRWSVERYHSDNPGSPGKSHTRWASLLPQEVIEGFDPLFFNISPREAESMDPQQRIFLELSWEALQDAGLRPMTLSGANIGIFAGVIWDDYGELSERNPRAISMHTATGKSCGMVANRVSYTLGLEGPSISIDTACSSSLVAIHLACQSLRTGDADMAIAGGVNLLIDPLTMVELAKFGGLSRDSRCKAFDADADGFVRGEGGGAVLLKPLSCAIRDGDRVYALVRGTAINNDGASNGLTAPSPGAQRRLLEHAYARADIDPSRVDYVEAHGTGTSLGDPIEAKALGDVFGGPRRSEQHPLRIGSVKTNIGHLEAAAGIAGFIKTVLAVDYGILPPSLHFSTPNPHIPFAELQLQVQDRLEPWPTHEDANVPRRAGVSAFGWGGTNCHVVVESYSNSAPQMTQWRVAARDNSDLRGEYQSLISNDTRVEIGNGAERIAITADCEAELGELFEAALEHQSRPEIARGRVVEKPSIAFVCSPQGGQWRGMARTLLRDEPVFRETIHAFDRAYAKYAEWSLLAGLVREDADWAWSKVHTIQPMILAVQVGLAAVWRSWGIVPELYIGHSLGEITAAHLCGGLNLDDTARLVIHYSRLQATTDDTGTMAIVGLTAEELKNRFGDDWGSVAIAGYNSPNTIVLSGSRDALAPVVESLQGANEFARFIDVNVAAHSPSIDPIIDELQECLRPLSPCSAHTPMLSTSLGKELTGRELGADYWPQNLRDPVQFFSMISTALERGVTAFVELNPHPILGAAIEQTMAHRGHNGLVVSSMRRREQERRVMLESLGRLFVTGHDPSCRKIFSSASRRKLAYVDDPAILVAPDRLAVPISGRSSRDLRSRMKNWQEFCTSSPSSNIHDVARTAYVLGGDFEHRLTVFLDKNQSPSDAIGDAIEPEHPGHVEGVIDPTRRRKVVFVCPGQGSQWLGMARDLLATQPVFREAFSAVDRIAQNYLDRALIDELLQDDGNLGRIDVIQPLLFAIEVSLGRLWNSWGVVPDAVIGHSMGEVAATYLAGALPLHHAVHVICTRSSILRQVSGQGAMLAAEITAADAASYIIGYESQVAVAVSNSPSSTVLSGDKEILELIQVQLQERGIFCRFVKVDVASHSPKMDPLLKELLEQLESVDSQSSTIPIYSTVDRMKIDGESLKADYWVRNLRSTVHFSEMINLLLDDGHGLFIELSPHPILLSAIEQCIDVTHHEHAQVIPSMRRDEPGIDVMLHGAASLYALGRSIQWGSTQLAGRRLPWSKESWARNSCWVPKCDDQVQRWDASGHPLLGRHIPNALEHNVHLWQMDMSTSTTAWLAEHRVQQLTIVSAAVYVEMLIAAIDQIDEGDDGHVELQSLQFENPLVLPEQGYRKVQANLSKSTDLPNMFAGSIGLFSQKSGESAWLPHVQGRFIRRSSPVRTKKLGHLKSSITQAIDSEDFYQGLSRRGLKFGPSFRSIEGLWRRENEVLARIVLPACASSDLQAYRLHPILLDGALQAILGAVDDQDRAFVTIGMERLTLGKGTAQSVIWSHVSLQPIEGRWRADVSIFVESGECIGQIEGIQLAEVTLNKNWESLAEDSSEPPAIKSLAAQNSGAARRARFEALVREQIGIVLQISADQIEPRRPFQGMGLTSLMTVELRNRLRQQFGIRLPSTIVWNYPTLETLLPYLEGKLATVLDSGIQKPSLKRSGSSVGRVSAPLSRSPREPSSSAPRASISTVDEASGEDLLEIELMAEISRVDSLLSSK